MPQWAQILIHILAIAAGSYFSYTNGSPLPLVISSGVQAVLGSVAQTYNTDGTPQTAAFVKK